MKPKKPARNSGVMFDDVVENDQTKCKNSIYDKFNFSKDDFDVSCSNNKCSVTCKATGAPARHQWPDGKISKSAFYICRGNWAWIPQKGQIVC